MLQRSTTRPHGICRLLVAALVWGTVATGSATAQATIREVPLAAARAYKRAEAHVQQGRLDEAEALLRRTLERHPDSGVYRSGLLTEPYYPHYLLGVVQLERERFDDAAREFQLELDQGQIQRDAGRAEALSLQLAKARQTDNQPPVLQGIDAALLETEFVDDGREVATVRVSGAVVDRGGLSSLTIDGRAAELRPDGDDRYAFDLQLPVDAARASVPLVATDVAGNRAEVEVPLTIPALSLGDAASGVHALIVGVDRYPGAGDCPDTDEACDGVVCYPLPDLRAAARDAERFHAFLAARGVPRENLQLLISSGDRIDATRRNVLDALGALKARHGRRALFYFAGHGIQSARQRNLMLLSDTSGYECAGGGDAPSAMERTALGVETVAAALAEASFDERYVILDACRSPRSGRTRGADSEKPAAGFGSRGFAVVADEAATPSVGLPPVVFFATFDESVSIEWHQKEAGYFTWYLLQGLRRDLSLWELKSFVQENVRRRTLEDHGVAQKPHLELPALLQNDYELQQRTYILGHAGDPP